MDQSKKVENLESLIAKLRPFLRRYLEERGVDVNDKGWFRCINPKHTDKSPSCGFIKETNEEKFYCFSCGAMGDIFNAANLLESRPLKGAEFITENITYIAEKYGVEYGTVELTPEELYTRRVYKAYEAAADIISENQPLDYITKRNWPVTLCRELKIGSVKSYEDFIDRMETRGYERSFVEEVDLNRAIFNEGMLTFSVKDERGRVVGFSSRDMSHSKASKRAKFINTSSKCPIYSKGVILYGMDVGRNNQPPLYIFEGYPDYVTAYKHGIKNVCAIGGTALTRDHIELIKRLSITDIILALDGDDAGQNRTEGLLDQYFGGDETIQVRILKLTNTAGESDPDEYLDKYGAEEFKKLPTLTPFQWRLERFSYDTKPEAICDKMIPLIISDPNVVHREMMAKELAEKTGVRLKIVLKQVDNMVNADEAQKNGVVQTKIRQLIEDLRFNKGDPATLLEITAEELRQVHSDSREDLNSSHEVVGFIDGIRKTFEDRKPGLQGWTTGYATLDEKLSGIPKEDAMITFAGDANVGKTGFMFELALRLAKYNPNIMVLFMSIDDSRQQAIARLVALEAGLKIKQVSHPTQNTSSADDKEKLDEGWRSIRKLVDEGRFSIKDNSHGNTLDFAEGWIRWAKETYPEREICFFLDNFHKLGDERGKEERIRFKHCSARIHAMKNKLHITAICTMELRKMMTGSASSRPSLQDISESKQMEYDNNMIGMVYSDVHAKRQDAKTFWQDASSGEIIKKPVFEIEVLKNKITEFKGTLYYKFNPEYSKFSEESGEEIQLWRAEYDNALRQMKDKRYPDGGENPFVSGSVDSF
jgi:DNA primase catalytic core